MDYHVKSRTILASSHEASVWNTFAEHELKNKYFPDNLCIC